MNIKKNFTLIMVLCLIISAAFFLFTEKTLRAQDNMSGSAISKKLDEILSNQKTIMQSMESMKSELNIIKIRITQQQ